jgi:hypothetical protein
MYSATSLKTVPRLDHDAFVTISKVMNRDSSAMGDGIKADNVDKMVG